MFVALGTEQGKEDPGTGQSLMGSQEVIGGRIRSQGSGWLALLLRPWGVQAQLEDLQAPQAQGGV